MTPLNSDQSPLDPSPQVSSSADSRAIRVNLNPEGRDVNWLGQFAKVEEAKLDGDVNSCLQLAAKLLELAQEVLPESHMDRINSLRVLAVASSDASRLADAVHYSEEYRRVRLRAEIVDDLELADVFEAEASYHARMGQFDRALGLAEKAISLHDEIQTSGEEAAAMVRFHAALYAENLGQGRLAETYRQTAWDLVEELVARRPAEYVAYFNAYAKVCIHFECYDEGLKAVDRAKLLQANAELVMPEELVQAHISAAKIMFFRGCPLGVGPIEVELREAFKTAKLDLIKGKELELRIRSLGLAVYTSLRLDSKAEGQVTAIESIVEENFSVGSSRYCDLYLEAAEHLLALGKEGKVEQILDKLSPIEDADLSVNQHRYWLLRSKLYGERGQFDSSKHAAKTALDIAQSIGLNASHPALVANAQIYLASLFESLGDPDSEREMGFNLAKTVLEYASCLEPAVPALARAQASQIVAAHHFRNNSFEMAETYYEKAIALATGGPRGLSSLGRAYVIIGAAEFFLDSFENTKISDRLGRASTLCIEAMNMVERLGLLNSPEAIPVLETHARALEANNDIEGFLRIGQLVNRIRGEA